MRYIYFLFEKLQFFFESIQNYCLCFIKKYEVSSDDGDQVFLQFEYVIQKREI